MKDVTVTLKNVSDDLEAMTLKASLQKLVDNLTPENIKLLGEKSAKPGMNAKLQLFKNQI